ncbi:HNH endonuclease [Moraxella catarrhalis]|uniref:HNH endonuclease signature motif containing protein n=1 Tax=Moraxella catarrhalis TaxID=480 RepID=UPI000EA86027|nr:HNH endonuclease signature motif containing protein [Moraxella catarrhalis]RKM01703.1 HNH endonuclease [Moraxella catarrhalis]RKM08241.1 HNH endonuclease [Moraxella catarrhalis]RKM08557.1 HNH endonuclease [Moraxella catarrhalis]RKM09748.1 HNH endonuclease [Moraxella catarrhalis]RKM14674.1 HNH endonuclease [Moraxella catarrhalis]
MSKTSNFDFLFEYLRYNETKGEFTWIKRPNKNIHLHTRAGTKNSAGYRVISLFGKRYLEHRLAWFYVHGEMPKHEIDHINQIRDDNRISNLRQVTHSENQRNKTRKDSRVDEIGIWWCRRRKRYIAEISLNGKKVYQKSFTDIDEAISARKAKALELGFHDNHGKTQVQY